jgi:hypothetical protein
MYLLISHIIIKSSLCIIRSGFLVASVSHRLSLASDKLLAHNPLQQPLIVSSALHIPIFSVESSPLLLLPLQPINPLVRRLSKPTLPLLHNYLRNSARTQKHTGNKQRRHQVSSSLRLSANLPLSVVKRPYISYIFGVDKVAHDVAGCLLARTREHGIGVVAAFPVALAFVVGVVDDLGVDEADGSE